MTTENSLRSTDVAVVGAGFAGLTAARELTRQGLDVVVLEGRDRVGGRSHTRTLAGVPVDLGATWVGPTQDEVLKLAADVGADTTPTFDEGYNLIRFRGRLRAYRGTIPRLSVPALLDVARVRWQFARLTRRVPVDQPWTTRGADRLDGKSLGDWLRGIRASASTRQLMALATRVSWGCEPDQISLLHVLRYAKACGGLDRILDTRGGAQQDHFPAGTQQIALRIAAELGSKVLLSTPVERVDWSGPRVQVTFDGGRVEAAAVIVAIPPAHRAAITFDPALPAQYQQLDQRWPQGSLSKAYAAYKTPFWRADGRSGQALSDGGPVFITFDLSPSSDGPGILVGFTDSRTFDHLPPDEREKQALACFAELFGEAALHPVDYLDHCWGTEPFAPGGPTAAPPPGSWTTCGAWLRAPVGPIHWAGTETATEWSGYLDGAVRSGRRAAAEVAEALSGR